MNTYKCKGFKSVKADSVSHAAKIFGNRLAQRLVGRGGYCCASVQDESAGTSPTFEITIGSIQDKYFIEQKEWLRVEATQGSLKLNQATINQSITAVTLAWSPSCSKILEVLFLNP